MMYSFLVEVLFILFWTSLVSSLPASKRDNTVTSSTPQVFAHYMLITWPVNGDYTNDILLAASAGISAFAVNYGGWNADFEVETKHLTHFYNTVIYLNNQNPNLNFKLFISIDTTSVTDPSLVVSLYNQFASSPAQLLIDGKPVLSSFQVNNPSWNWQTDIIAKLSTPPFFLPGTLETEIAKAPNSPTSEALNIDAILSARTINIALTESAVGLSTWLHPTASMATELKTNMALSLSQTPELVCMTPISPWFFKRLSASENWGHAQDDGIFIDRFTSLLSLPVPPRFVELVTWNDYGESTYFGPADSRNTCKTCYYDRLDHSAFLTMAKPFISAFKAGDRNVTVPKEDENVFMFYRTQPALTLGWNEAKSPAGNLGLPWNATEWKDEVFVVGMLNQSADVVLNTGGMVHKVTLNPGVTKVGLAWDFGAQSLDITFANGSVVVKEGPVPIVQQAEWYNGNVVAV